MWENLALVILVLCRYEAALIALFNRGYSLLTNFFILSVGMVITTFTIHWLSGPRVLPAKIHFPRPLIFWLRKQKIIRSYLSYHEAEESRKRRRKQKLGDSALKSFYALGYIGIALMAMIPIPLLRSTTVVAARVANLKYGVYVILGAAEAKVLLELIVYYRYGKLIPFADKLTVWHLAAIFFGGFIVYTAIGWLSHAIEDDHFRFRRFD